jgi:hypothetical protein
MVGFVHQHGEVAPGSFFEIEEVHGGHSRVRSPPRPLPEHNPPSRPLAAPRAKSADGRRFQLSNAAKSTAERSLLVLVTSNFSSSTNAGELAWKSRGG